MMGNGSFLLTNIRNIISQLSLYPFKIVLHSGHFSKIFKRLMGTGCMLKWREIAEKERVWVIDPAHPIAEGLPEHFEIPHEEM